MRKAGARIMTTNDITNSAPVVRKAVDGSVIPAVKAVQVHKAFGPLHVLKGIDLTVMPGTVTVILGPSGSGKSTFLRLINQLETLTGGSIEVDGELIGYKHVTKNGQDMLQTLDDKEIAAQRSRLGMVFQRFNLFPHMTALENVMEAPIHVQHQSKKAARDLAVAELQRVGLGDRMDYYPSQLSGGQQQRVAIARAIVNEPEVLLLDEPLAALDLKMRKDMQMELKEMHKSLGITFVYVTHDQEEALTLSDTIVVMSEGRIQQIGTPIDIYNEPINSFVADFIGESNILNGVMIHDKLVCFCNTEFECVDEGFGENMPVDVVIRPEDLYIFPVSEAAQLTGVVQSSVFKGVHYEMTVLCNGYEFLVQDYHHFEVGALVGLLVKPFDIHIMKKERVCNTFEGKLIDETHVEFLGCNFECAPVTGIEAGSEVKVEVGFDNVILQDNEEDGALTGEVKFILYKGDHYHLTVLSDWDENVFVDTNDVWDDGDRVGITIPPDGIRVIKN